MLTSKKKTEILELLFLSDSLFSMMECYQGEEWLKDRLLEREEKVEWVTIFFLKKFFFMMNTFCHWRKAQYLRTANKNFCKVLILYNLNKSR